MEEHRELAGYKSQASKPLDYSKGVRCHLPSGVFPRFLPECDWVYRGARQVFSTIKFPDHVILWLLAAQASDCTATGFGLQLQHLGLKLWTAGCGPRAMAERLFFSLSVPSQPPASPSTQEAIQGMLSMANLQASDSCLQTTWGTGQAKGGSLAAHGARKNGGSSKGTGKRLLKRTAKNSVDLEDYEEQDHLDACFKDSDYGECGCRAGLPPVGGSTD